MGVKLSVIALDYDGTAPARAATLRAFVAALGVASQDVVDTHARRGDFSRWLRDVFGDYTLAQEIRRLEGRSREEQDPTAVAAIASAIRGRYDLTPGEIARRVVVTA